MHWTQSAQSHKLHISRFCVTLSECAIWSPTDCVVLSSRIALLRCEAQSVHVQVCLAVRAKSKFYSTLTAILVLASLCLALAGSHKESKLRGAKRKKGDEGWRGLLVSRPFAILSLSLPLTWLHLHPRSPPTLAFIGFLLRSSFYNISVTH